MPKPNTQEVENEPILTAPVEEAPLPEDDAQLSAIAAAVRADAPGDTAQAEEPSAPADEAAEPAESGAQAPEAETPAATPDEAHAKAVEAEMAALGITKDATRARFHELADKARAVDEITAERDQLREAYQRQSEVFEHFDKAGVTGDQFGVMLAIAGDVNSGDPARLRRAYDAMTLELQALAKGLGMEAPGFDPLAAHKDLAERVDLEQLERADALEIAQSRAVRMLDTQRHQRMTQQTEQEQRVSAASSALDQLEVELKARDPHYAYKAAIVTPLLRAQIQAGTLPPEQWAQSFAATYAQVANPVTAPAPPVKRPDPGNPSRPGGGVGAREPRNAAEAIMLSMGRSLE